MYIYLFPFLSFQRGFPSQIPKEIKLAWHETRSVGAFSVTRIDKKISIQPLWRRIYINILYVVFKLWLYVSHSQIDSLISRFDHFCLRSYNCRFLTIFFFPRFFLYEIIVAHCIIEQGNKKNGKISLVIILSSFIHFLPIYKIIPVKLRTMLGTSDGIDKAIVMYAKKN